MVRGVAVVLVAVLSACAGRSARDDGRATGGSGTGGSGATTGGSNHGGSSIGGFSGSSTGGSFVGGFGGSSSGGSSSGGSAASSGGPLGGTSGTGAAGMGQAGAAGGGTGGEGGATSECLEPNPAGCVYQACPSGKSCVLTSGRCSPSSCSCEGGEWACTRDCNGGVCADGPACTTEKPPGCFRDSECAPGEVCNPLLVDICLLGGGCVCDPFNDEWICNGGCAGGTCGIPE
jgi:hypothetical protein